MWGERITSFLIAYLKLSYLSFQIFLNSIMTHNKVMEDEIIDFVSLMSIAIMPVMDLI